jgi:hypothetical protein
LDHVGVNPIIPSFSYFPYCENFVLTCGYVKGKYYDNKHNHALAWTKMSVVAYEYGGG